MISPVREIAAIAATLVAIGAHRAGAQSVMSRMDSTTTVAVERIVARANAEGLPGDAIRAKALEGVSRGVSRDRMLRVVAAYADTLRVARDVLTTNGMSSPANEDLVATADVLIAGVSRGAAGRLATAAYARAARQTVTVPFVVVADLVARGVPGDSAVVAVGAAVRRGASDAELWRLREAIVHDIADGASPLEAAMVRTGAGPPKPVSPPATSFPSSAPSPP